MLVPDLDGAVARLQEMVEGSTHMVVPFTEAGISTECGIPISGRRVGFGLKNRPIPFEEFLASQDARNESWRRRFSPWATSSGRAQRFSGSAAIARWQVSDRAGKNSVGP